MEIPDTNELSKSAKQDFVRNSQLIRIDEVSAITTLAKSSINLWVAQSKFPKPIHLSPTVKVWLLEDIIQWIKDQSNKS